PENISDRSTGILQWKNQLIPYNETMEEPKGIAVPIMKNSSLRSFFADIKLFTVNQNEFVRVIRYAPSVKVEQKMKNGDVNKQNVQFTYNKKKSSIGFQVDVDALMFRMKEISFENIKSLPNWPQLQIELRPNF